jgi:hypothetical protein
MPIQYLNLRLSVVITLSVWVVCSAVNNFVVANTAEENKVQTELSSKLATVDQFRVHGLAKFNADQQNVLRQWLSFGINATRSTLGVYPKPLELYIYSRPSNQPVPWAHTQRDKPESIHFYVDARFTAQQFIDDWTVYHELAHLAIPFVGEDNAWFSEGFASYMQYQIMAQKGVLVINLANAYKAKITPHLRWFQVNINAAAIAKNLMEKRNYPAAYWSGAYFFVLIDQQLQAKHYPTLIQLIEQYQQAGREQDDNIQGLLSSLDTLINDSLFSELFKRFNEAPAKSLYPPTLD